VKIDKVRGAGNVVAVTATATRLLVQRSPGCTAPFPISLAWLNPATGAETVVVPVSRGDAGVLSVVPYFVQGKR
jgi:hypothetical protein